jgi:hypothetical protein
VSIVPRRTCNLAATLIVALHYARMHTPKIGSGETSQVQTSATPQISRSNGLQPQRHNSRYRVHWTISLPQYKVQLHMYSTGGSAVIHAIITQSVQSRISRKAHPISRSPTVARFSPRVVVTNTCISVPKRCTWTSQALILTSQWLFTEYTGKSRSFSRARQGQGRSKEAVHQWSRLRM